ncbi:hypothetical protein EDD29_6024 [Actinocorallia herbida]|uniref:Excreted virulence factor EspC (Type VII ESX diderm) n=1 Tax=Actinocorallia herbida TaxID=58109 RepID=A0A3N1D5K0_9ACTN|nr:hypothetical protein [Actinocorallia herbida]ROO88358.1 hypothetical protein EDD29_6024 [Actinocorallia herbida]
MTVPRASHADGLAASAESVAACAVRLRALAARLRADPATPPWLAAALDAHLTACTIAARHLTEAATLLTAHTTPPATPSPTHEPS